MKLIKIMVFVLFLLSAKAAFAEEIINENTGDHSHNTTSEFTENVTVIKNVNTGVVKNEVVLDVESGGNKANENTGSDIPNNEGGKGGGSVTSGDASLSVTISNVLNSNVVKAFTGEEEGGKGGGGTEEIAQVPQQIAQATLPTNRIITGTTLPSTGPDAVNQMAMIIGLPLLGVFMIRIFEIKTGRMLLLG